MTWVARARSWLMASIDRRRLERDLEDELRFHLEAVDAESRDRLTHSLTRVKEECRDARGLSWLDDLRHDVANSAHGLRKSPLFTTLVLATLAFGIGATVTVFSLIDAWLLKPLPLPDADRLVVGLLATQGRSTEPAIFVPYRSFVGWRARSRSFAQLSAVLPRTYVVRGAGDATTVSGLAVTPEFFDTLGAPPLIGRTLPKRVERRAPAVLSYGLWERQFDRSADVVGRRVVLNGVSHEIVGVMPRTFDVRVLEQSKGFDVWTLLETGDPAYGSEGSGPVAVIGRLASGVTIDAARADVGSLHRDTEQRYAPNAARYEVLLTSLQADNTRTIRATLVTVGAAVAALLLVACLNVGTLLLGRGLARTREAGIRASIGCGRARLVRQFLVEGFLLSVLGGLCGVAVAWVVTRLFVLLNPLGTLPANPVAIDLRALSFAALAMVVATLGCGAIPACRIAAINPTEALRAGGDRGTEGTSTHWMQALLLGAQMAVSVVLLVGAALLVRTFARLQAEPLGFDPRNLTVVSVALPLEEFPSGAERHMFFEQFAARLDGLAGVTGVAAATAAPLTSGTVIAVGTPADDASRSVRISAQDVTIGFFDTARIPLIVGRTFEARDTRSSPAVVVVNETAARTLFGSVSHAVRRRIRVGSGAPPEVVGVVRDTRSVFFNTLEWLTNPVVYFPAAQKLDVVRDPTLRSFGLHVHIRADRALSHEEVRAVATMVNPRVAVTRVSLVGELVADATRHPTFRMALLSSLATISLLHAAIGVYGLVAHGVKQRVREIGIRLALGASAREVIGLLTQRALVAVVVGTVGGTVAALAVIDAMRSVVYGVRVTDPSSFATATATLLAVAALSALVPALRASRINPVQVLRAE